MNDSPINNSKNLLLKGLEKYGINLEDMVDTAMELCISENKEDVRLKLKEIMLRKLEDPNLLILMICALKLEEEGIKGNLPFNYHEDPNYIYIDEVIGMAIANEISGTKGIFNFRWYDAKKPGVIGILDKKGCVFLDDAVAGFIAGCMSKVFE
ncbi:phosphatidylglycerophosphatase A [Methanofervidicoccus sp. A16]|uniref:phosphatidylglycerophosphatase A n=1 Tax=Methanofervidicoccus sp. A16 TaxID=2607662 RepID=UPI00118C2E11|nr:phosphatidylglycerophosphatase A [Methanofervidicoccus sp. A16]AXI24644.1 phosphatidylglycerophosphatase A [Methanofervidicoccus sp. A16]